MPLPVMHQSNLHRKFHWLCAPTSTRGKSCKQECWAEGVQAESSENDGAHSAQNQTESSKFLWLCCKYTKAKFSPVCFAYQTNGKICYHRVLKLHQRRGSMSELSGITALKLQIYIYINLTELLTLVIINKVSFLAL